MPDWSGGFGGSYPNTHVTDLASHDGIRDQAARLWPQPSVKRVACWLRYRRGSVAVRLIGLAARRVASLAWRAPRAIRSRFTVGRRLSSAALGPPRARGMSFLRLPAHWRAGVLPLAFRSGAFSACSARSGRPQPSSAVRRSAFTARRLPRQNPCGPRFFAFGPQAGQLCSIPSACFSCGKQMR